MRAVKIAIRAIGVVVWWGSLTTALLAAYVFDSYCVYLGAVAVLVCSSLAGWAIVNANLKN